MPVQKLFLDDSYLKNFQAIVTRVDDQGVYLDQTAFYATSGGQACDVGTLNNLPVLEVVKAEGEEVLHKLAPEHLAQFAAGQQVEAALDWARRFNHMRFHTALHLMCKLVHGSVTGCGISADKARVDFNVDAGQYTPESITEQLNTLIAQNYAVSYSTITDAELDANPSLVRSLSVQPPRGTGFIRVVSIGAPDSVIDRQPCGGTHVKSTAEIGKILVTKIENKGKENRRFSLAFAA